MARHTVFNSFSACPVNNKDNYSIKLAVVRAQKCTSIGNIELLLINEWINILKAIINE